MIWHAIFSFFYNVAVFITGLLPDMTDADLERVDSITAAFQGIRGYMVAANQFFPVDLAFTLLLAVIGFEMALALWKLIRWVASILSIGIIK